jgi:DNA polymerase/3'-5' exonuclease PolX
MSRNDAGRAAVNSVVANMLREAAELLSAQQADPFRVAAYRKAAASIAGLAISVRDIFER